MKKNRKKIIEVKPFSKKLALILALMLTVNTLGACNNKKSLEESVDDNQVYNTTETPDLIIEEELQMDDTGLIIGDYCGENYKKYSSALYDELRKKRKELSNYELPNTVSYYAIRDALQEDSEFITILESIGFTNVYDEYVNARIHGDIGDINAKFAKLYLEYFKASVYANAVSYPYQNIEALKQLSEIKVYKIDDDNLKMEAYFKPVEKIVAGGIKTTEALGTYNAKVRHVTDGGFYYDPDEFNLILSLINGQQLTLEEIDKIMKELLKGIPIEPARAVAWGNRCGNDCSCDKVDEINGIKLVLALK